MKIFNARIALGITSLTLLAATSTAVASSYDQRLQENLQRYQSVAGEPVRSFTRMLRTNISWEPLGDHNLLYSTSNSKGYLLTVEDGCVGMDTAQGVIVGRGGSTVHVNTDRVKVLDTMVPIDMECKITEIRPVDLKAYRALRKAQQTQ